MAAKPLLAIVSTLIAAVACLSLAQAEDKPPSRGEMLIKFRQSVMTVQGGTFGPLAAMSGGKMPYDAKRAQVLADRLASLAGIASEAFPPDSKEGAKTKAKPEIWTDRAEFDKYLATLGEKTAALAVAAKAGTLDALKPAVGDVGKACKGCHEKYEEK
jgi:cytochrome c556